MGFQIPLLGLKDIEIFIQSGDLGGKDVRGIQWIATDAFLPEGCYAVRVEELEMMPHDGSGCAVFCSGETGQTALEQLYLVACRGSFPVLRKLVRRDEDESTGEPGLPLAARTRPPRKSFMTPTPLHIPGSRVSPIPGYTHASLFLKAPGGTAGLEVLPLRDVWWMHPLVRFVPLVDASLSPP